MSFEWDEAKRAENIRERGLDFADVLDLFDIPETVVFVDDRKDYGEPRFILLGPLRGKLYQVVFTPRGQNTRIISARRASKRERRLYAKLKNHYSGSYRQRTDSDRTAGRFLSARREADRLGAAGAHDR